MVMDTLRFRALWALIAATNYGSTNQAAGALNLTQPAQPCDQADRRVAWYPLSKRCSKAMELTEPGDIFRQQAHRVMNHLLAADKEIAGSGAPPASKQSFCGLHWRIARQQLIMPMRGTPTHSIFEAQLAKHWMMPPKIIESSSLTATRALRLENNYLTFISRSQIHYEQVFGILAALHVEELAGTQRPIGVTARADASHSPPVRGLIRQLRTAGSKLNEHLHAATQGALQDPV